MSNETFNERQARENAQHYAQWLSCGYKGDMVLNEYGWCRNDLDKDAIKVLNVIESKQIDAEVEYAQLPNGKWVAGTHLTTKVGCCFGHWHGASIWGKQYDTKGEAVTVALDGIMNAVKNQNSKALTPAFETAFKKYHNQFANASVFDAFFGAGASFEQVSLF